MYNGALPEQNVPHSKETHPHQMATSLFGSAAIETPVS